ncbi:MAG TPA: RIP metalloprotease RseP [Thioalkalivibrio sp.]|mgnify:CR=1 FL=1|nr:RIP metalloprotease RseP [Thioalkalivibrio sp.]
MTQFLVSILAFIVAIGLLVAVHEFGHFWVARRLGVKVLRFSIGFGRPILRWRRKNDPTEYVIAALPLGGYVRMLDEREGEVDPAEQHLAFNRKGVWSRIAIVAAGPAFNFLFALVAYWLMFMVGVNGIKPYVDDPPPASPAYEAGLQAGDRIVAVAGRETPDWEAVRMRLLEHSLDHNAVQLSVADDGGRGRTLTLDFGAQPLLKEEGDFIERLGLISWRPYIPVVAKVTPGGAAERAGIQDGDWVMAVDGREGLTAQEFVKILQASPERELDLVVERDGRRQTLTLRPDAREVDGQVQGFINAAIGGTLREADREKLAATITHGPIASIGESIAKTGDVTLLTLRLMGKLVTGDASLKNVSGPITIADYAGLSALVGLAAFLYFLAMVSISLGIINLLPVPILDGGHLLYYVIELIKGSPLSEAAQALGQRIGLAMLAGLMMLAIYNDLTRLFS